MEIIRTCKTNCNFQEEETGMQNLKDKTKESEVNSKKENIKHAETNKFKVTNLNRT
jgi:hypothetical protein